MPLGEFLKHIDRHRVDIEAWIPAPLFACSGIICLLALSTVALARRTNQTHPSAAIVSVGAIPVVRTLWVRFEKTLFLRVLLPTTRCACHCKGA